MYEQHAATQDDIAAVAGKLGDAVEGYNQMEPLIAAEVACWQRRRVYGGAPLFV